MSKKEQDIEMPNINLDTLNADNMAEWVHQKVGECSTLFYRNKDNVFDEQAALNIAQDFIDGINKLRSTDESR